LHAAQAHKLYRTRAYIMKLWLVAFGAIAFVAARAVYSISTRQSRRRNRFNDQVSSEWLATAKIHEDHP
jgi:hypothetical protein